MIKKFENFINEQNYVDRYSEKYLKLFERIGRWISTTAFRKADIDFDSEGVDFFQISIHLKNTDEKFFIKVIENENLVGKLLEAIFIEINPNSDEQVELRLMTETNDDNNIFGVENIEEIENFDELLEFLK